MIIESLYEEIYHGYLIEIDRDTFGEVTLTVSLPDGTVIYSEDGDDGIENARQVILDRLEGR